MVKKAIIFLYIFLFFIFLYYEFSLSGEAYRWEDSDGTIYFTDDISKIPKNFKDKVEVILFDQEVKDKPVDRSIPVMRIYQDDIEKRIEERKKIERRLSELDYELKKSEERLKEIEEYEKLNFLYYMPYKDKKTGKWVKIASPYHEEKRHLKIKIETLKDEINILSQKLSEITRGL